MAKKSPNVQPQTQLVKPKTRTKTKGGCRTCKVRKVKCDEQRPCCHRCQSTGRICEGYGIWGGGDADSHYTARQQTFDIYRCIGLVSSLANSSPDEKHYFEWFRSRTTIKLPGVFGSGFWEVLVMQVSHSESAALHAILAVSCAHKRLPSLVKGGAFSDESSPDKEEQFMLQHYSKAICEVQKSFSADDRASVRVVLIVCMLFVILEFMCGRTKSGLRHLRYGLKVIDSFESRNMKSHDYVDSLSLRDTIDKWLLGAFSRLNLQALLFGQLCGRARAPWQLSLAQPLTHRFDSIPIARDTLDDLTTQVLELTEIGAREDLELVDIARHFELTSRQKHLQSELEFWASALQISKDGLHAKYGFLAPVAYQSLMTRYITAKIMADRCFSHGNEGAFDRNTSDFRNIIAEAIKTYKFCFSKAFASTRYAHKTDVAPFVVDGAWIWPLHYTAIKCRVRRIRLQALRLLGSTYSMEAVCDSSTAAAIAREIVEIEEPGLSDMTSDFDFLDEPRIDELLPPAITTSSRLFDVQVTLANFPIEMTVLECKRKSGDSGYEVLRREYDSQSQIWINKTTRSNDFMD